MWYNYGIEFEYDALKSESNKQKHGIDFEDAKKLWLDPRLREVRAKTIDELRLLMIGKIDEKHWSAVVTYRLQKVRIISVRRSRGEEIRLYEES